MESATGDATAATTSRFASERVSTLLSPRAWVAALLRMEAAIATAESDVGMIPPEAATAIAAACDVDDFDVAALQRAARAAGNDAIPLVDALTRRIPEEARRWVHVGTTSQDLLDTATVLQTRDAIDTILADLLAVGAACARLTRDHADTVMAARTLLQQATPTTFGLKAAHWLAAATGGIEALRAIRASLPLQFGGAGGTLSALGDHAEAIVDRVAQQLDLVARDLPWHTDREPFARVAAEVTIVAGAMAKIALDVALLMQTEVGEAFEGEPGPSSAMPQKRNPVHAPATIAAARLAASAAGVVLQGIVQEHERGLGSWHAEREALSDVLRYGAGAVEHARAIVEGLRVDPARMRANLDLSGGTVMAEALVAALVPHVGRPEAHRLVAEACERVARDGVPLREAAGDGSIASILGPTALVVALEPTASLGSARRFAGAALARFERVRAEAPGA
jgi:3-carboxy-cis,cis-muconate cycloisomerase